MTPVRSDIHSFVGIYVKEFIFQVFENKLGSKQLEVLDMRIGDTIRSLFHLTDNDE